MKKTYWYNGKLIESETIPLEIGNPGLIYGATLFTTLRVYEVNLDHPLTHWQDHLNRLRMSLKIFEWPFSNWQRLREGAEILAQIYPVLRLVIWPDGKEWITGRYLPDNLLEMQQEGVRGWIGKEPLYHRSLSEYKTGNYLGAWLGLQKAQKLGAKEGILIDYHGNWLETCTGNLWGWKGGIWYLPPVDNILDGIMRSHLLNWLKENSIPCQEILWTPELVNQLDLIAYSNSVVEIVPFQQIIDDETLRNFNSYSPILKDLRGYFETFSLPKT